MRPGSYSHDETQETRRKYTSFRKREIWCFCTFSKILARIDKKLTGHPSSIDFFINLDKIGAISGPACLKYLRRAPSGAVAFYIESFYNF